jgi:hypothetical protein
MKSIGPRPVFSRWMVATVVLTAPSMLARAHEPAPASWKPARTVVLGGLTIAVSQPVQVAESKGYLWFPTLMRLDDRRLVALMSNKADELTDEQTAEAVWSTDGGLTWGSAQHIPIYSECPVKIAGGHLLLPYCLFPQGEGAIGAGYMFCRDGKSELVQMKEPLTISGWPRPLDRFGARYGRPDLNLAGFVFNGQCIPLNDGRHIATLYGHFQGTKRFALVAAASKDGRTWEYLSTVADETCKLHGKEGPCEAAICRLKDGRLMCVFRVESGTFYGRSFSRDDGKTWSEPDTLTARSVQPSLMAMPDGLIALSGGRPGVSVWFNVEGDGARWQPGEILPDDAKTSGYTEIVQLDERSLLCIYDRVPHGWTAIPADSRDTNSVWVVRLMLDRPAQ